MEGQGYLVDPLDEDDGKAVGTMKRTCARLLLLCVLVAAGSAWGVSQKEHEELLKNADYRQTWGEYQALAERAKKTMTSEDFLRYQDRENKWYSGEEPAREAKESMADGMSKPEAFAGVLAARMDETERLLDRAEVIRQSDGVSGLYRRNAGTLEGTLLVRPPEDGEYAVELLLMQSDEPAGYFEGSAKLKGKTLAATGDLLVEEYDPEKDSAAVTLTFDSAGATAVTTEKFKRDSHWKKWLDEGVVFDGAYTRQKSVFMDAASD
jgi:hypothetical protein